MSINSASFFPISKIFHARKKMDFQVGMKRTQHSVQKRTYNKKPKMNVPLTVSTDSQRKALAYGIKHKIYKDIEPFLNEESKCIWINDLHRLHEDWQQELRIEEQQQKELYLEQILTPDLLDLFDRLDRENGEVGV